MRSNPLSQDSENVAAETCINIFEVIQEFMKGLRASVQIEHLEIERPLVLYVLFDEYPFQCELMCGSTADEEVTNGITS